jgi:L-lactate dehydrogenase
MKVGIVGCGMVGSASAYALVMSGVGRELVLVDVNEARARAEANDISGKGATYYGIGSAVSHIVDVVLHDRRAILTICGSVTDVPGYDGVTLALPRLLGGSGVLATLPLPLDPAERDGLARSVGILRQAIHSVSVA